MTATDDRDGLDYGPLAGLIGSWAGDRGMDVAPEPDGSEESPYHETLEFTAAGDVTNAESQRLVAVHYRQVVRRKSTGKVFHDESGYWIWDAEGGVVMHALQIPRGVGLLAGGRHDPAAQPGPARVLEVRAHVDDPDWGIVQSPFMRDNARTVEFRQRLSIDGDRLAYDETTVVDIYGRVFEHTDRNALARVG